MRVKKQAAAKGRKPEAGCVPVKVRRLGREKVAIEVTLTAAEAAAGASARKKRYCCSCGADRIRKTISASNSISAALKCYDLCGRPGFSLSKGACVNIKKGGGHA